jgi:hypothetical protein
LKVDYLDNKKVQRWLRCFQGYNFEIVPIKGSDNIIADAFSRLCVLLEDEDDEGEAKVETTEAPQEEEVDVDTTDTPQETSDIPRNRIKILRTVHNELIGHNGSRRMIAQDGKN